MGQRRTFDEWLAELREVVRDTFEMELEDLPEFDRADARTYFREKSSPSLYFKECLSEHDESGEKIEDILREL